MVAGRFIYQTEMACFHRCGRWQSPCAALVPAGQAVCVVYRVTVQGQSCGNLELRTCSMLGLSGELAGQVALHFDVYRFARRSWFSMRVNSFAASKRMQVGYCRFGYVVSEAHTAWSSKSALISFSSFPLRTFVGFSQCFKGTQDRSAMLGNLVPLDLGRAFRHRLGFAK